MKISFNWLKQYFSADISAEEASKFLTACGLEVESLEKHQTIKGGLEGVVVGEVKTKIKHPNADKLSLTTVDIGGEFLLNIVCGAPNVEAGQKVLVATIGTTLYPKSGNPLEIKKSKIRGEASEGMLCAEDELGLGTSHDGLLILDSTAKIGTSAKEILKIEEDYIFEIGLTPNRVDASSHIGVARDLIAAINSAKSKKYALEIPSVEKFKIDNQSRKIEVVIEDIEACPRYSGITISGIEVKTSPDWLQNKLKTIGVKPINNVVDVTNFVLHECGQPLHAFDADEIKGSKVIVKKLKDGTLFTTLDEAERKLSSDDLMICNADGGMCIAGVFGGKNSGVKSTTKNIFIESAYFSPSGIRRTSKRHGLKTDAAFRYERGADPEITLFALKRAAMLIQEICGGTISSEIVDVYPTPISASKVSFSLSKFEKLCGVQIAISVVKQILSDLGIKIQEEKNNILELLVPQFKPDVKREADISEEILRIWGYDNIPIGSKLRAPVLQNSKPDKEKIQNTVADYLTGNGFLEIITHSLVNKKDNENAVTMLNPLSEEMSTMRQTLLYSGLQAIEYNRNRKNSDLKFFEFGKSYHLKNKTEATKNADSFYEIQHLSLFISGNKCAENWSTKSEKVNFFFIKSMVENIFEKIGIADFDLKENESEHYSEAMTVKGFGGVLCEFGKIKSSICKKFDINTEVYFADFNWEKLISISGKTTIQFTEIPKFPEVKRDLSMMLERSVKFSNLEKLSFDTEKNLLKKINLFDVYEGEKIDASKKSYAVSFYLQDNTKTLTDVEVDKVMEKLISAFETKLNATIRKN